VEVQVLAVLVFAEVGEHTRAAMLGFDIARYLADDRHQLMQH
jgi:hypothetical protein